jgi:antitoxin (DNA-binding transcriptional repressor) of toxin-antitoxin stability system
VTGEFNEINIYGKCQRIGSQEPFGQLLERVAQGEEFIITLHDKPVARLIPEGRGNLESVRAAVTGLFELRGKNFDRNQKKSKLTAAEVKLWIGGGRG